MPTISGPVPRPTVRVLLVDDNDRLLLFSAGQHSDRSVRWFAAGGGVRLDESHEQAALREVREETGLTDVTLSREIWRGRPWVTVRSGVAYHVEQRYYLARVPACDINTSGLEEPERTAITGHRWWTAAELATTDDVLRPTELPQLFARLLSDGLPDRLVIVSG